MTQRQGDCAVLSGNSSCMDAWKLLPLSHVIITHFSEFAKCCPGQHAPLSQKRICIRTLVHHIESLEECHCSRIVAESEKIGLKNSSAVQSGCMVPERNGEWGVPEEHFFIKKNLPEEIENLMQVYVIIYIYIYLRTPPYESMRKEWGNPWEHRWERRLHKRKHLDEDRSTHLYDDACKSNSALKKIPRMMHAAKNACHYKDEAWHRRAHQFSGFNIGNGLNWQEIYSIFCRIHISILLITLDWQ